MKASRLASLATSKPMDRRHLALEAFLDLLEEWAALRDHKGIDWEAMTLRALLVHGPSPLLNMNVVARTLYSQLAQYAPLKVIMFGIASEARMLNLPKSTSEASDAVADMFCDSTTENLQGAVRGLAEVAAVEVNVPATFGGIMDALHHVLPQAAHAWRCQLGGRQRAHA